MQVRNAGRTAGVSSSTTAIDPFAGLGDLPGLAHVGPDIDFNARVVVTAPVRLSTTSAEDFSALSKRLWLVHPSSLLLEPLTLDIDVTRRPLSQRTAVRVDPGPTDEADRADGRDGKDQMDTSDASTRKRKRDPQEPALTFVDPRDGLSLARPDSHNLGEVVAAMARQLVRQGVADRTLAVVSGETYALGRELGQQLGGLTMPDALRDRVLRAVLRLALPPEAGSTAQPDGADPGIGPLDKAGFVHLCNFLRGFRCALPATRRGAHCAFARALADEANRLSLDSLHAPGRARLQVTDYARCSGPLELVVWTLGLGTENVGALEGFLDGLLRHLLQSCLPAASATDRSWHGQCLLASLAWLPLTMQSVRESHLGIFVQVVTSAARSYAIDAGSVGIGLARALAGVRSAALETQVLNNLGLDREAGAYESILGAMAAAYLRESTGQAVAFLAFLERVPHLQIKAAGRLAYRLALAEGRAGQWDPAQAVVGQPCRLRLCMEHMGGWDRDHQRAVLHGLLGAVPHLAEGAAGFAQLDRQLRTSLEILYPAGHVLRSTVLEVLDVVRDPQHVFAMARDKQRVQWAPLHIGLVLTMHHDLSHQFLSNVVRFLLGENARTSSHLGLLLRIATNHPETITQMRLPRVRILLLAALEPQAQPGAPQPVAGARQRVLLIGTIKALQRLYGHLGPHGKVDFAAEIAAVSASRVAAQLQSVLDTLRRLSGVSADRRERPTSDAVETKAGVKKAANPGVAKAGVG